MTHEQLAANNFLDDLPEETRAKIHRIAIAQRSSIAALIKKGLLSIADDINGSDKGPKPTNPARYTNRNAA
jgi:hypothetical protein